MITVFLLIWICFIVGNALYDANIINAGQSPFYLVEVLVRGMAAILHGVLFDPHNTLDYLPVFIFQVSSFYIIFEIIVNLRTGRAVLYLGKTAAIDRFFQWIGYEVFLLVKLLALVGLILSTIVIYYR